MSSKCRGYSRIVARHGPPRDDSLIPGSKERGKYPCLQRDLGRFQFGGVRDFHMNRTVKAEGSANLPGWGNTRRSGGRSLEEGAVMTVDSIARVRFATPQSHQPLRERHSRGEFCAHDLVPIHCQRGRIAGVVQVACPAGEDTWRESGRRQEDRFTHLVAELHWYNFYDPPSVAVSNQPRPQRGVAQGIRAVKKLIQVRYAVNIRVACAALAGEITKIVHLPGIRKSIAVAVNH